MATVYGFDNHYKISQISFLSVNFFLAIDKAFHKEYYIRVAYPEHIERESYWIQFKILFSTESVVSKIEIEKHGKSIIISDFENNFFSDIERIFQ